MGETNRPYLNPAGLYIHIPFCKRKCSYCCFHFSTNLSTRNELVQALLKEIKIRASDLPNQTIHTLYFGGGTPSLFTETELYEILHTIKGNYQLLPEVEISIEANPDDITNAYSTSLLNLGFNRMSIGIQSFFEEDLKWMNRSHTANQSRDAIETVINAGFINLSIDLMYGLPSTDQNRWKDNLNELIKYNIPHFSAYSLTLEERTSLHHLVNEKKITIPPDEETIRQMNYLLDFCELNNYEAYEISNFSKTGFRSKHNSSYWEGIPYLGFGPSAHSYIHPYRSWNVSNNNAYIKALVSDESFFMQEKLNANELYNEYMMLQLRRIEGLDLEYIANHFPEFLTYAESALQKQLNLKNIQFLNGRFQLTRQGKTIADSVSSDLFVVRDK
ncbi:MAG: radical SAM family heme chaperone HemW [Saprospiraceae bacterium]